MQLVDNKFKKINENWIQIGNESIYVDIIKTSEGFIRIGSMPDISKLTRKYGIEETICIVSDWIFTQGGDNRTGEEFNFWNYAASIKKPPLYIGKKENLNLLYKNLDMIYSYYFDSSGRKIVKTDWLKKYFQSYEITDTMGEFRKGNLEIIFDSNRIVIRDNQRVLYDTLPDFKGYLNFIENTLSRVPRKRIKNSDNSIEITVIGNGNGFTGTTSSFVATLGNIRIWIDPAPQPAFSLGRAGINWDDITHLLITHNHEDHISGFSACLKRVIDNNTILKLITAPKIYEVLIKQFKPMFENIEKYIELIELSPENPLKLKYYQIEARWNHHIIPYGTLGIKIKTPYNCWGLSGDTKYDEKITEELNRKELEPEWFKDCNMIFHEVDFINPNTVHTYYKELLKMQNKIKTKLFVYHTDKSTLREGFKIAEETKSYYLYKDKIEIR